MSYNLEQILGFKVKVTNLLDNVTQGKVYSFNSSNNTLTLLISKKSHLYSFKVIKTSFIKSLEVVGEKPVSNSLKKELIKPNHVNIDQVQKLLSHNINEMKKKDLLTGKNVNKEGQFIFDILYKTVPDTVWQGKNIVILDELEIVPPYSIKNIRSFNGSEAKSLSLVTKIVKGAWLRLESQRQHD